MDNTPQDVIEVLAAVRESGAINMFDRRGAIELAEMMGYDEEADWLRENKARYMDALNAMGKYVTDQKNRIG
jgi:hypothetical protein